MAVIAAEPRASRMRVVFLILGAVLSAALIALGAFMLLELASRHSFVRAFRYPGVRSLVVRDGAGDVTLTAGSASGAVLVTAQETEALDRPTVRSRLASDGTLSLNASCPGNLQCGVHYFISVPSDVAVEASSGFGELSASGLTSTSSLQLSTTAGDLHASGISAPDVRLSSGFGSLNAELARPAARLVATTVAGDLNLTLPRASYAVHASPGVGSLTERGLRIDPAAPRSVEATSSLGHITITEAH